MKGEGVKTRFARAWGNDDGVGGEANGSDEVDLHQRTQHVQQTGGAGSYCTTRKPKYSCNHQNLVG